MNLLWILPIGLGTAALGAFGLYAYISYNVDRELDFFNEDWHKRQDEMFKNLLDNKK